MRQVTENRVDVHKSDESNIFNLCCMILSIFALGIFVVAIIGIEDALAGTSTKKVEDL